MKLIEVARQTAQRLRERARSLGRGELPRFMAHEAALLEEAIDDATRDPNVDARDRRPADTGDVGARDRRPECWRCDDTGTIVCKTPAWCAGATRSCGAGEPCPCGTKIRREAEDAQDAQDYSDDPTDGGWRDESED